MTNDNIRSVILNGIAEDAEFYQSDKFRRLAFSHWRNRRGLLLSRKASHAAQGIVPYKPSQWLGRPLTGAERAKFCRVLEVMSREGLVVCYADSRGRTTHVALTEARAGSAKELNRFTTC